MHSLRPAHRPVALTLLAIYLLLAALVAFWPTPVDSGAAPFLNAVIAKLHNHGVPAWLGYDQLEFAANILFFIPLGYLLTLLLGRDRWWFSTLLAAGASVCIEVGQQEFLAARFSSIADVVANTLGALVGALVAHWFTGRRPRQAATK